MLPAAEVRWIGSARHSLPDVTMIPMSRQDRVGRHISVCHREGALVPSGSLAVARKAVHLAFDGGRLTSDAGVLVLAAIERRLGIAESLARCIVDLRTPGQVRHSIAEMIRFRVLLIAAGYPDANDCDALRTDPAFKMALGRFPESGADLCSQPTMSRLENLPTPTTLKRIMASMIELFCDWTSPLASARVRNWASWTRSVLSEAKKLSMGALSRQLPRRLMDGWMPCRSSTARYGPEAYCTPRSLWWISPRGGRQR